MRVQQVLPLQAKQACLAVVLCLLSLHGVAANYIDQIHDQIHADRAKHELSTTTPSHSDTEEEGEPQTLLDVFKDAALAEKQLAHDQKSWLRYDVLGQDGHTPPPHMHSGLENPADEPPMYELVIARLAEPLHWLPKVPTFWAITVYNKGGNEFPLPEVSNRTFRLVNLTNGGREAGSYAHHLATRYDSLAEYTVFTQGNPFDHSPNFFEMLRHPSMLSTVQSMSLAWNQFPPLEVLDAYRKHPWYRSERISLRTLDSLYFHDDGAMNIAHHYREVTQIPVGTNIIAHFLDSVGLPGWVPREQEIGSFAWGGIFGVHQTKILQHDVDVYKSCERLASNLEQGMTPYVLERTWMMLFGGRDISDP